MAYRTGHIRSHGKGHMHETKPGEPFCTNCNRPGHWIAGCWSKGGGAKGKGPCQKRKFKKRKNDNNDRKNKGKNKANQAVRDDDDESDIKSHASYMASNSTKPLNSRLRWVLDGGATTHICNDQSCFAMFTVKQFTIDAIQKNAPVLEVLGIGDITVTCPIEGDTDRTITLRNIAFSPNTRDNLISESHMDKKGLEINKFNGRVSIRKPDGKLVMQGIRRGGLFKINCYITLPSSLPSDVAFSVQYGQSFDLWHRQLAHTNEDALRYLVKHNLVTGMDLQTSGSLGPCDGCAKGKHPQAPFPKKASRATEILGRLHMDLQGHFKNSTLGFRYTLAVVDDCS
jgi:hypothetical protein